MKKQILTYALLAMLPALSFSQSIIVGNATGNPGGSAAPLPVAITFTNVAGAGAVVDIDSRLTYDSTKLTIVATSAAPGSCSVQSPGNIFVTVPGTGPAIASGVICNLTAISIDPTAAIGPTPLTLANGVGSGCSNAAAVEVPCGYVSGAVTVVAGSSAPILGPLPAAVTLTGGTGTAAVTVATAGNATASISLACTIPVGTAAFAITAGANRTIYAPATVGANAPAIGLSCTPQAASTTSTLSCNQTAIPAGAALPALTSTITCPAIPTVSPTLTYAPAPNAALTTVTFPAGLAGATTSTISVTPSGSTGGGSTSVTA